jgi:predicted MPP superfamily phosphohydrolase
VSLPNKRLACYSAVGLLGLLAYARFEAEWFKLRGSVVPILPADAQGLRILQLADLHFSSGWAARRKADWVARLVECEPDLIVLTGDNLACPAGLELLRLALGRFSGYQGCFVFGSNDYYAARLGNPARYLLELLPGQRALKHQPETRKPADLPWQEMRNDLLALGWLDLNNARGQVDCAGQIIDLVGMNDPHIGLDCLPTKLTPPTKVGDAASKRAAADETPYATGTQPGRSAVVQIGVVHAPYRRALDALANDGAQIILAGHTHGGQLALPGFGALVANCDLPPRLAKGLHKLPGPTQPWLNCSAGLGTSPYTPFRLACRPEAVLLNLVPAPSVT